MIRPGGNCKEEAVKTLPALAKIAGRPGSKSRCHFSQEMVMICIRLLKDADEPFSPWHVDRLPARVVVQVVGILNARKRHHGVATIRLKNGQSRRVWGRGQPPVASCGQR